MGLHKVFLMDTAKEQASGLTKAAPGGVGGLVGAGYRAGQGMRVGAVAACCGSIGTAAVV